MAQQPNDFQSDDTDLAGPQGDAPVRERVRELTWAAIDEVATDDDVRLLDSLLLSDDEAVEDYVGCVQLHVDLLAHFATGSGSATEPGKSAFGFLNGGTLPLGIEPQQS
jgi:hypothetical protein